MVNYDEAIRKPFTDLKNLVIGIVLSLIPIVNFTVVTGFAIESSGLGKTKPSKKMPEWRDWGNLFIKGLTALVIKIIYMIPAVLVIALGVGVALSDLAGSVLGSTITPELMNQIETGETTSQQILNIFRENWYLILPAIIKAAPALIIGFILALIASFVTPIAVLNYLKNKRFNAAFEFGTVFKKALTGKYVTAWLVVAIIGTILGFILSLIPIIGQTILSFIMGIIGYSIYGQVYKEV
jgi:uncharacterized protein involved in cysteine biosynthesis